jgi:hypothetical protein
MEGAGGRTGRGRELSKKGKFQNAPPSSPRPSAPPSPRPSPGLKLVVHEATSVSSPRTAQDDVLKSKTEGKF